MTFGIQNYKLRLNAIQTNLYFGFLVGFHFGHGKLLLSWKESHQSPSGPSGAYSWPELRGLPMLNDPKPPRVATFPQEILSS